MESKGNSRLTLIVIGCVLLALLAMDITTVVVGILDGQLSIAGIIATTPGLTEATAKVALILTFVLSGLLILAGLYLAIKAFGVAFGKTQHTRLAIFLAWIAVVLAAIALVSELVTLFSNIGAISLYKVLSAVSTLCELLIFVYYIAAVKRLRK